MCLISDPRGVEVNLPDDLPVVVCHKCERFAVRFKLPPLMSSLIKHHICYGRIARYRKLLPRPVCVECENLTEVFGEVA